MRSHDMSDMSVTGPTTTKLTDLVQMVDWPKRKWLTIRIVSGSIAFGFWWLDVKKKDGQVTQIPKPAHNVNSDGTYDTDKTCPYYEKRHLLTNHGESLEGKHPQLHIYANVLVRKLQEDAPARKRCTKTEKKSGYMDGPDSESWTPI